MDRVYSQTKRTIEDVSHAAIAIQSVNSTQRHVGILHRQEDKVLLLHLAWHHDLRNHLPGKSHLWIELHVPQLRMRQVAAICRKVWRSNEGILPYALSPPNDCFNQETGAFLFGPTQHGLTCASFVLAVFEAAGLRLADYETWPTDRPGDQEWQSWIVGELENSDPPADARHIEAVRSEVGLVRYRPEDVAGAATTSPLPANFATANEQGEKILRLLGSS